MNNSYSLNDKYFLFLFDNTPCFSKYGKILVKKDEKKNIIFYKIDENNDKILYQSKFEIEGNYGKLCYVHMNNKFYIITHNIPKYYFCEEITNISFYEIINMKNNKKINIKI